MRPVDLSPPETPVVVAVESSGASRQTIGVLAGVGVALLGVIVFFAFGRVNTLKEQAADLQAKTMQAQQQTEAVNAQIAEAGQSNETDYKTIAQNMEQQLVSALNSRLDYVRLERELAAVLPPGAWFQQVTAGSQSSSFNEEPSVTLRGYASSAVDIATLVQRLNSAKTFRDAQPGATAWEKANNGRRYLKFEITAIIEGTLADGGSGGGIGDPDSALVGGPAGGSGGAAQEVELTPDPVYGAAASKAKKSPPTALETAADAAARHGGGS